jgi:hypothetical protein
MNEIDAWTHADLKDVSLRQRDYTPANVNDRLRISQHTYEMRINMVFVKRHTCSMRSVSPTRPTSPLSPALTSAKKISLLACL